MNDFYVEFSKKINSINFNKDLSKNYSYRIDSNYIAINTCKSEYDNGFFEIDNKFLICSNSRIDNRNELKEILKINHDIDDAALILKCTLGLVMALSTILTVHSVFLLLIK